MSRQRHPNSVIKPIGMDKDFVMVSREFAQDHSISHFTRSVILDISSRSEDYETNVATIMTNFKVGRDKAEGALREGVAAGYIHVRRETDDKGRFCGSTYHISNSKAHLRIFVESQGWNIHALKKQGPDIHALKNQAVVNQAVDSSHNYRREGTKEETELKLTSETSSDRVGETHHQVNEVPKTKPKKVRTKNAYTEEFDKCWLAFPARHRMSKPDAFKSWVFQGCIANVDAVMAGIEAYKLQLRKDGTPDDKVKHMQGWLTGRRWEGYAVSVEAERESQIKALALDWQEGHRDELQYARKWWLAWRNVPQMLRDSAARLVESWGLQQEGAFA